MRLAGVVVITGLMVAGCVSRETTSSNSAGTSAGSAQPAATPTPAPSGPAPDSANAPPAGDPLTDFLACKIDVTGVPSQMKAGSGPIAVTATVTNSSMATWPAMVPSRSITNAVNVGYHYNHGNDPRANWVSEGNHFPLPGSLAPGNTVTVPVAVIPPSNPGSFLLVIEPVQERVAWFSARGGCAFDAIVQVN